LIVELLYATEPLEAVASPEPGVGSLDVQLALPVPPSNTAPHVIATIGFCGSTLPEKDVAADSLPALSLTVPLLVNTPDAVYVDELGTLIGSTPLPALLSASAGSPAPANVIVTVSFHQSLADPAWSYSGARLAAAVGAFGAVLSMLMLPTVADEVLPAAPYHGTVTILLHLHRIPVPRGMARRRITRAYSHAGM